MNVLTAELIGTFLLVLLGDGVVANVVLSKTKGNNAGWIVITFGWSIAVFTGVFVAGKVSGAHLNPAVSVALTYTGAIKMEELPVYIAGQFVGAMLGSFFVWVCYKQHFDVTTEASSKLAVFCTGPAIANSFFNFFTELIGTFVLVFGVLFMVKPHDSLGSLHALPVALLVLGIGLSLGGPTGYAINPARDLGPRIMHAILPIKGKGSSDWKYSWIPVVGPIAGGLLAAIVYQMFIMK
ncbi:MAG TPA: MIP/aquaporin family protein [Chitinophagaceae bacterium]|nr:MIP/aquaporin family protein [Chitinophagaceae bacterium]